MSNATSPSFQDLTKSALEFSTLNPLHPMASLLRSNALALAVGGTSRNPIELRLLLDQAIAGQRP